MTRRYALLAIGVIAIAAIIYLLGNNTFPLVDRDEPRYAQASRQMLETGDWITPRYLDALRLKKPILIYWLQASSMKLFGDTDFAARLPSVIASVFTLLIFAITWPLIVGYRRALWAVFIFATMLMPTYLAKVCMTDAVLHVFIAIPMLCLYAIWMGRARAWMLIVMGLSLGLSMLTKGPPAFLFVGMTLLALSILGFTVKREPATLQISPQSIVPKTFVWTFIILALAVGVCVPWALKLDQAHPGALMNMFFDEVVKRGNEPQEGHTGPPGFYFVAFWGTAFPWCLFWPAALWHAWKRRHIPWVRFSIAAIIGPWVFLEIYKTKLPHYWLPSYPFVALLIADVLVRAIRGRIRDLSDTPFIIAAGVVTFILSFVGIAILGAPLLGDHSTFFGYLAAIGLCVGILASAWGVFLLLKRHELSRAAIVMGLSFWAVVTFTWTVFAPATPALNLAKRVGLTLREMGITQHVEMIDFKEPSLAFYQGGTIREQNNEKLSPYRSAPNWIVISDEAWQAQTPEAKSEYYQIVHTFRGVNFADGKPTQTVHILKNTFEHAMQKAMEPTTEPTTQTAP